MGLAGAPPHGGQSLSPARRRQQRSVPRASSHMRSAGPAPASERTAAVKLTTADAAELHPGRHGDGGQTQSNVHLAMGLSRDVEQNAALHGTTVLPQAYAPALLAARAAARAALDPGNGRPPARVLAAFTRSAAAGAKPPHYLQSRPSAALLVARKGRPPTVLTLAQLQKRYGGRKLPHRAAAEPPAEQAESPAALEHVVGAVDCAAAAPAEQTATDDQSGASAGNSNTGDSEAGVAATGPAARGLAGASSGVAEPNWEWMVEGVLRQVVLHLDMPNSVVRFRQVNCADQSVHIRLRMTAVMLLSRTLTPDVRRKG